METVGASRRFFACAHKGGAERPNVRRSRTEDDAQSRDAHGIVVSFGLRAICPRQEWPYQGAFGATVLSKMVGGCAPANVFRRCPSLRLGPLLVCITVPAAVDEVSKNVSINIRIADVELGDALGVNGVAR